MRIKLDAIHAAHRFPRILGAHTRGPGTWHVNLMIVNGTLPARTQGNYIARWLDHQDETDPADVELLDRLRARRQELQRQRDPWPTAEELATITPQEMDGYREVRDGRAALLKEIERRISYLEADLREKAERDDFARLVRRLEAAADIYERARILDREQLLSAESRRKILDRDQADQAA